MMILTQLHTETMIALPADLSNENPYEDIELESQCSQQSLPSSPGADTGKVSADPPLEHRSPLIQTPL